MSGFQGDVEVELVNVRVYDGDAASSNPCGGMDWSYILALSPAKW